MKTEFELFCLVETNYQWGLGHWYRVSNFINQTLNLHSIKNLVIVTFGDFQPEYTDIHKDENQMNCCHLSNFKTAYEYLTTTLFRSSPQKEKQPYLVIDINHQSNNIYKLEISLFKSWFYTIGFYSKTNNITDLSFSAHVNPNYFKNQSSFKKSSSNTLYLLGPEFRVFSKNLKESWTKQIFNSAKSKNLHVLVIAGNTDPQNRIPSIIETLKSLSETDLFTFHIVIPNKPESQNINGGKFYSYAQQELTDEVGPFNNDLHNVISQQENSIQTPRKPFIFYGHIKPADLIKIYPKMDAAITAVGATFWEINTFRIPCLLIPGSSEESITARWLTTNSDSELLLESHEQFTLEHSTKVLNFLSEIKNDISNSESNRSNPQISNNNQTTSATSQIEKQITSQGTPRIWQFIIKHSDKYRD